ncbi:MAG TPA: flagellar hook-basal body complex protein FliE [Candidatus Hydrogenedentes bacterium]|nr:flagellar hook-basal body complex protein FliE [Candidatus Hydrogenedentota bacterium]HOS03736.1 flagellar hook-basal body complex protein FliE [Candidatus Hydrogenedentota bacterium]
MADAFQIPSIQPQRIEIDPHQLRSVSPGASAPAKSFQEVLAESIGEVERLQQEADTTIKKLVAGEIRDTTEAMIAVERADIGFQTMMVIRNKMVAAYEQIMQMQV